MPLITDARYQDRRGPMEDHIIAEGDKVVIRWTCTGTHHGTFRGNRADGNRLAFSGMNIYRLRDGKVVERWGVEDGLACCNNSARFPMIDLPDPGLFESINGYRTQAPHYKRFGC